MLLTKKNDYIIGFVVSVLLSLFVNFYLLMRVYERTTRNDLSPFDSPAATHFLYFSLAWFFLFSIIMFLLNIQLFKIGEKFFGRNEVKIFLFAIGISFVISFVLIQIYPVLQHTFFEEVKPMEREPVGGRFPGYPGEMFDRPQMPDPPIPFIKPLGPHPFSRPLVTEHLFVCITLILIVLLIRIINARQEMILEVERLKTEKLQTSYNALMGQINPHFFFNSLNGLNSLIRAGEKEHTLHYLDELSNVFRYILQSNKKELVSLAEELQFVKAYAYLLEVRYEGKLHFSINTDTRYMLYRLPILSLLPLIENAVKHNVISKQYPLQVDIYTMDDFIIVSNKIQPKNDQSLSNGIGIKNLWGRYRMLTGKDIIISHRKEYFKIKLPLLNSSTVNL